MTDIDETFDIGSFRAWVIKKDDDPTEVQIQTIDEDGYDMEEISFKLYNIPDLERLLVKIRQTACEHAFQTITWESDDSLGISPKKQKCGKCNLTREVPT
jgi:hypothetical protein